MFQDVTLEEYLKRNVGPTACFNTDNETFPKELRYSHIYHTLFRKNVYAHHMKDKLLNTVVNSFYKTPGSLHISHSGIKYTDFPCIGDYGTLSNGYTYSIEYISHEKFYLKVKAGRKTYFSCILSSRYKCLLEVNKEEFCYLDTTDNFDNTRDITITASELYRIVERIFYENGAIDRCFRYLTPEEFIYNLYEIEDNIFEGELNGNKFTLNLRSYLESSINEVPLSQRLYYKIISHMKEG